MFRPLPSADNVEPGRPRPVDKLRDQSRLVAVRHAVDDSSLLRFASQERTGEDVGLDIDHNDVLFVFATQKSVADAGRRASGYFEDYIYTRRGDQGGGVGRDGGLVRFDPFGDGERCL